MVATVALAIGGSCARQGGAPGKMAFALTLPNGATVESVGYGVETPGRVTVAYGQINVADPNATLSWELTVPVGTGYVLSLAATTVAGVACAGESRPFDIAPGLKTVVNVILACGGTGPSTDEGSLLITATEVEGDDCPGLTSWEATPLQTSVGGSINVTAAANDPDVTDTLTYAWSPAELFADPTAPNTTFRCTISGQQTLTLTVKDDHAPISCATKIDIPINCVPVPICSDGTSGPTATCQGSTCYPILTGTHDTGFDRCDDGAIRRRASLVCPEWPTTTDDAQCARSGPASCASDADCTAGPLGYCAEAHHIEGYCGCFYGCRKDADCGAGQLCDCGVVVGQCVAATCTTSASCGTGLDCIGTRVPTGGGPLCRFLQTIGYQFACQSPSDSCRGDLDCTSVNDLCILGGSSRACQPEMCPKI